MTSTKLNTLFAGLLTCTVFLFTGCESGSVSNSPSLSSNIDSVSYSLGYQFASMSLKRQGMDDIDRSEERRVGKECRYRWWRASSKKRQYTNRRKHDRDRHIK